jgi:UDP-N-acetylmuramate dehydrogenase
MQLNFNAYFWRSTEQFKSLSFMEIVPNFKKYNTFGIEAKAKQFVAVHSVNDLKTILQENKAQQKFILGGGSICF